MVIEKEEEKRGVGDEARERKTIRSNEKNCDGIGKAKKKKKKKRIELLKIMKMRMANGPTKIS
jgi:hypothetical protein